MTIAPKLAIERGCRPYPDGGFRIVVNTGAEGGQEVHHLHVHVIAGPRPWLPGPTPSFRPVIIRRRLRCDTFFRSNPWVHFPSGAG